MLQVMQRLEEDGAAQLRNADERIAALTAGLRCCHSFVKLSMYTTEHPPRGVAALPEMPVQCRQVY